MGMVCCYVAVPENMIDAVKIESDPVNEVYFQHESNNEEPHSIDLDKSWHAINFMLTGEPEFKFPEQTESAKNPLLQVIFGGEEIGEDLGYGPARFLNPSVVKSISNSLQALSVEDFSARFNPEEMDKFEIYPQIWVRDGQEGLDYILYNYRELVGFFVKSASRNDGVLTFVG
jgi:hypothetical protein